MYPVRAHDRASGDGDHGRQAPAAAAQQHGGEDQGDAVDRAELRTGRERNRERRQCRRTRRGAKDEIGGTDHERAHHEIVERARALEDEHRVGGEKQRRQHGSPHRQAQPEGNPANRDHRGEQRHELRQADESIRPRHEHCRELADLGVGRVDVESQVDDVGQVPDRVLLPPEQHSGDVVRERVALVLGREEKQGRAVQETEAHDHGQHSHRRIADGVARRRQRRSKCRAALRAAKTPGADRGGKTDCQRQGERAWGQCIGQREHEGDEDELTPAEHVRTEHERRRRPAAECEGQAASRCREPCEGNGEGGREEEAGQAGTVLAASGDRPNGRRPWSPAFGSTTLRAECIDRGGHAIETRPTPVAQRVRSPLARFT